MRSKFAKKRNFRYHAGIECVTYDAQMFTVNLVDIQRPSLRLKRKLYTAVAQGESHLTFENL